MKFPEMVLRLLEVNRITTQKGKQMTFVKLANEKTFESAEFVLNVEDSVQELHEQTRYKVYLKYGQFSSVVLQPEKVA